MQGVRLVRTPAAKSRTTASAGLELSLDAMSEKSMMKKIWELN
jgi:hypothetical protein